MNADYRSAQSPASAGRLIWTVALLLPLGGLAAAEDTTAPPISAPPEVWLCAGDRIMELLQPGAEWPFVKQHLTGIKLYVGQLSGNRRQTTEETPSACGRWSVWCAPTISRWPSNWAAAWISRRWTRRPASGRRATNWQRWPISMRRAAGGLPGPRRPHPAAVAPGEPPRRPAIRLDRQGRRRTGRRAEMHRAAHPETKYWLLTNFPNWGWRGDVSYHARGPQRQDYGDYDQVVRIVLEKLRAAEIPLDGVTVDNPYDYLVGEHFSVNLADPKSVDWLARVRSYEDFAREQGLTFNLIVNSQRGGQESDERFFRETLQMVDTYRRAGGRPTRWFVQSWYPHPKQMLPETAPPSMTALVKAVIAPAARSSNFIVLQPQSGAMQVTARVPALGNQAFALGIPETIGCREAMLVNFPEAKIDWQGPDEHGVVSCSWGPGGRIAYTLRLVPADDYIDVEMTVRNHTEFLWRDVFAFNCINPIQARTFQDWKLERTYMSREGKPFACRRQPACKATCRPSGSICPSTCGRARSRCSCGGSAPPAPIGPTVRGSLRSPSRPVRLHGGHGDGGRVPVR
jgi:hypothetical protein